MHELEKYLERIFDAKILFISVENKPTEAVSYGPSGINVYTNLSPPHMNVRMTLSRNDHERLSVDFLHIFDNISQYARMLDVRYEQNMLNPHGPFIYTVQFAVGDYNRFAKDLTEYSWKWFSEDFNSSLDKVLDEEN